MHPVLLKGLKACGLVILTGPLCFTVAAQYVDLEAERAAAEAAGRSSDSAVTTSTNRATAVSNDPYGAKPAAAYPATSYGVNSAPVSPSSVAPAASAAAAPASGAMAGSELGNMFLQMQQMQQEIMRLNGRVEELTHEVNTLSEQSRERYMDLDKRLAGGPPPATNAGAGAVAPATDNIAAAPAPSAPSGTPGVAQPGEKGAYEACYALVTGRKFDNATTCFRGFLDQYPGGPYAANAHYWLGELYLVAEPPDLESARQSFALLLSQYPENSKAPDALYKLGKVQFLKGNREKAREYMDLVISQYSGTNNAVVKLAQDFIAHNEL